MGGKLNEQNTLLFVNTGKTPYLERKKKKIWNGKLHLLRVLHTEK